AKVIIELADYFDVSTNYLLGQPEKNKNQLEQIIDSTIDELKNEDTLLFMKNGEFDENTARLLKAAIKNGIKTVDDMTKND
ncbi:MAG TPA: transcriptional regulator, partial [Enterococcus faecalis]|nr:transcriptional regulator [Enterococcus faecalis]